MVYIPRFVGGGEVQKNQEISWKGQLYSETGGDKSSAETKGEQGQRDRECDEEEQAEIFNRMVSWKR